MPFGSGGIEIFEEHYCLFNGVFMRVPGNMVELIAELPEVFGVFPNVAFDIPIIDRTHAENQPSFVNPEVFMREAREYLQMDYIHNEMGITGAGVRVAVIDTGIYHAHPEFERFLDETGRIRGWLLYNGELHDNSHETNPNIWFEARDHGTTVSGAVIGIAPGIELWNYRIALSGVSSDMGMISGIIAAHRNGADVINMSFNTTWDQHIMAAMVYALNIAVLDGVVAVAIAGNNSYNGQHSIRLPGTLPLVITVGSGTAGGYDSLNSDDVRDYSSFGPVFGTHNIKPDIIATSGITTTSIGGGYVTNKQGTSFAAPIIAGIAALLIEAFPDIPRQDRPHEIKTMMMNTAREVTGVRGDSVFCTGAGFVQPINALRAETLVYTRHYVDTSVTLGLNLHHKMPSLSFGLINADVPGSMEHTLPLYIENRSATPRTYTVSYSFNSNRNNAASIIFSDSSITVAAGSIGQIDVNLVFGAGAISGYYEGFIYVSDGEMVVARLPFAAMCVITTTHIVSNEMELRAAITNAGVVPTIIYFSNDITLVEVPIHLTHLRIPSWSNITLRSLGEDMRKLIAGGDNTLIAVNRDAQLILDGIIVTSLVDTVFGRTLISNGGYLTLKSGVIGGYNLGVGTVVGVAGIFNAGMGTFNMHGGEISGNSSISFVSGGGVTNNGIFNMYGGVIKKNSTFGVSFGGGGVLNQGIFNMYGGVIKNNTSRSGGGVSVLHGTFNMHGGEISNNENTGIVISNGIFTMHGGEVSNNEGSGIGISSGIFTMHGGKISNNTTRGVGGGVSLWNSVFYMHGGEISANIADSGGGIGIHIADLRAGSLHIGSDAIFANNIARTAFNRNPIDDAVYYEHIHATQWSHPFTQGFNNFDIQYIDGGGTQIPNRTLSFQLGSTFENPTNPLSIEPLSVVEGMFMMRAIGFPDEPTRTGYLFAGWYLDSNFTQKVTAETVMPNSNTTIFANWVPLTREAIVRFHFDGEIVEVSVQAGQPIDPAQIPVPATRYGSLSGVPGVRSTPGQVHMGWFEEIFPQMHYVNNPNRAVAFDLTQPIPEALFGTDGILNLYASWLQFGDLNGDGIINPVDSSLMSNLIAGNITLDRIIREAADVNVDGIINPVDLSMLRNFIAAWPVILGPIPQP